MGFLGPKIYAAQCRAQTHNPEIETRAKIKSQTLNGPSHPRRPKIHVLLVQDDIQPYSKAAVLPVPAAEPELACFPHLIPEVTIQPYLCQSHGWKIGTFVFVADSYNSNVIHCPMWPWANSWYAVSTRQFWWALLITNWVSTGKLREKLAVSLFKKL